MEIFVVVADVDGVVVVVDGDAVADVIIVAVIVVVNGVAVAVTVAMILLLVLLSLLLLMLLLLHDQTLQGLMVLMLHLNLHHLRVRKKVLIESKKFFARAIYISLEIKMLPLSLGENFRRLSVVLKESHTSN